MLAWNQIGQVPHVHISHMHSWLDKPLMLLNQNANAGNRMATADIDAHGTTSFSQKDHSVSRSRCVIMNFDPPHTWCNLRVTAVHHMENEKKSCNETLQGQVK